jgi:DNA mismatch repair protein MutS
MSGAVPDSADTPLMRQYLELKDHYPDCIVFFRLGDFYEMFFDDAVVVARTLDLTLTTRDKGKENPVPMCGVPHHAAKHYLGKLVAEGFKVAIAEQVEDPRAARGANKIVRREVVRIVTPGVILDEEQLDAKVAHYLVALFGERGEVGVAYLDITTGEFAASSVPEGALLDELARLEPREVLHRGVELGGIRSRVRSSYVPLSDDHGTADVDGAVGARRLLIEALGPAASPTVAALSPLAVRAAAGALTYARATQPTGKLPIFRLAAYRSSERLLLDEATRHNLELFHTIQGRHKRGSLIGILDETGTAMGGRLLRRWLSAPLVDVAQIRRRHDAVEWLVQEASVRVQLRGELKEVYDLERLTGRVTLGVATPRDLVSLAHSLERLPMIAERLEEARSQSALGFPELLLIGEERGVDVAADIRATLIDDPPAQWREGGFCRRGLYPELDELIDLAEHGKERLQVIEARERERTGIASLKVRYNRVFGYYLEITRSNLDRVPPDYVRKQTLANAERFVTAELAEYEAKILTAEERRLRLELETFDRLRARVTENAARLQPLAELVARLDALGSLAEVAHGSGYVRPTVDESERIEIEEGRHPVVEKLAAEGRFVPNDVTLDPEGPQLIVITGPNMAGKSTAMRQVALMTLMAQMGSFVPARRARFGVVDRVFTRVGASDNLAEGESTFMVEMRETANILRHATRRSLVILDEIGRGTSTYDGVSIAWAVAEHLHDRVRCKTMFATHYHELTGLQATRPRVRNHSTAVREWKDDVVFLHKVIEGAASRSYGIQVAKLAGLSPEVIARARQILGSLERAEERTSPLPASDQLSLYAAAPPSQAGPSAGASPPRRSALEEALKDVDLDGLSPREAHALLCEWKARFSA